MRSSSGRNAGRLVQFAGSPRGWRPRSRRTPLSQAMRLQATTMSSWLTYLQTWPGAAISLAVTSRLSRYIFGPWLCSPGIATALVVMT